LTGSIPTSLANLTKLRSTDTNIGYNALHTSDAGLIAFLNIKDPDWASTQTIAPTNVSAVPGSASVTVSWTPITYTGNSGGYRIFYATVAGGPYTFYAQTANKGVSSQLVSGLTPGIPYYFVVRTRTNAHPNNQNVVDSENSDEVSATITAGPTLTIENPAGAENYPKGSYLYITWSSNNISGNINIDLYKGGRKASSIKTIDVNTKIAFWLIPKSFLSGDYQVKITHPSISAISNSFKISEPSIPYEPDRVFFDDFDYKDPFILSWEESSQITWQNTTIYNPANIPLPNEAISSDRIICTPGGTNRGELLLNLKKGTGIGSGIPDAGTPQINTFKKFNGGKYWAKVKFSGPLYDNDHVVETFWIQNTSDLRALDSYAEVDFEYLPHNFWLGLAGTAPTMWLTTWGKAPDPPPDPPFNDTTSYGMTMGGKWYYLMMNVVPDNSVEFRIYSDSLALVAGPWINGNKNYAPEAGANMSIFFEVWGEKGSELTQDHSMTVDWVMHIPNNSPSGSVKTQSAADFGLTDVLNLIQSYREKNITIRDNVESITVSSPNGGETWMTGSNQTITWNSFGSINNVKIECSTDSGLNFTTLVASTANTGSYGWVVPNTPSSNCLVRISEASSGTPSDTSDAKFTIAAPTPPTIKLDKTKLNFGAISGGSSSSSQTVIISNIGEGTLGWTATSNKSWLGVTPSSGTGTGVIQVNVNPVGEAVGMQTGTITISDPNASNNPQTIDITLTVKAAGSGTVPFGDFATPIDGTTGITGAVPVTGWVLDDIETTNVKIWRDAFTGETPGLWFIGDAIFVEGARPDIETAYPNLPLNYRAGWGYMLLTNFLPAQGNGTYKIHAYATDKEGNQVLLGTKTITCDNDHAVKPFGTIDTPAQGGDASGNAFVNFGWVLTPLTKTVPKDGSTIDVYVDSVKLGNLATAPNVYNQYRVDVSNSFPGLNNSSGPVGAFYLDTTKYANGVHTIYWIATDDAAATDGIGSRYFNIVNTGTTANEIKAVGSTIAPDFAAAVPKMDSIARFLVFFDPVSVKRGFDLSAPAEMIEPDRYGVIRTEMREVERLELDLGKGPSLKGYLVVGNELRGLPIGSTLDTKKGTFSWLPGPGFLGTYNLVFVQEDEFGIGRKIPVVVTIKPKFRAK